MFDIRYSISKFRISNYRISLSVNSGFPLFNRQRFEFFHLCITRAAKLILLPYGQAKCGALFINMSQRGINRGVCMISSPMQTRVPGNRSTREKTWKSYASGPGRRPNPYDADGFVVRQEDLHGHAPGSGLPGAPSGQPRTPTKASKGFRHRSAGRAGGRA